VVLDIFILNIFI